MFYIKTSFPMMTYWCSKGPSKVLFFTWLALKNRNFNFIKYSKKGYLFLSPTFATFAIIWRSQQIISLSVVLLLLRFSRCSFLKWNYIGYSRQVQWIFLSNGAILGRVVKEGGYGRYGFLSHGLCGGKEIRGSLIIIGNLCTLCIEEPGIDASRLPSLPVSWKKRELMIL